jgi:hypothetical protein
MPACQVDVVVGRCLLASVQCRRRPQRSRPATVVGAAWRTSDGNACPCLERERGGEEEEARREGEREEATAAAEREGEREETSALRITR